MGSLRDLKRESKTSEAPSDTMKLYFRLQELAIEHGKSWAKIAEVMEQEGFKEKGEPLSANALRKRYVRWTEDQKTSRLSATSEPVPPHSPIPGVEELICINSQLLEQIQESNRMMQGLGRRLEEQHKTSHTEHTDEQPVSSRDLLELLREITSRREQQMHVIKEPSSNYLSREEVQQLIDGIVEEKVEAELKAMLSEGGSFSRDLIHLIDQRLKTLFSGGEPVLQTAHAGPGRGRKGKTHKKFSASLESDLYNRVKSLPGMFSQHLANSLEAYLAVMGEEGDKE